MKKISTYLLLLASVLFINTSCDDYLDVNNNIDAPDYVEGYLYLAGITQAYQGMYWDLRATGPLTQMIGTSNTTYTNFASNYFALASDGGGEIWRTTYFLQGMNLENMINQSISAEDWTLAGIGYALKAYSWDQMTKEHGELPLKEAFLPDRLSHDYDTQDTIYAQIRRWAYQSIELLQKTDNHVYGAKITANDFIYQGNKDRWIKFAYGVVVRNLSSLSNKKDFTTKYAQELINCAQKSFQSADDDAAVSLAGGSQSAAYTEFNNYWGTARANLSLSYFQHEYAVQVFTGTVPKYDEGTGEKYRRQPVDSYRPYELADKQIICDTLVNQVGHYDPRVAVKLATVDDPNYNNIDVVDSIKVRKYYGSKFTTSAGPIGTAPSFYGRNATSTYTGAVNDGKGRWIYRDDAPYVLMTCAELKFCLAEAYWKLGNKSAALDAFKAGVKEDMNFTAKYIYSGTKGQPVGGDKITKTVFTTLATQYLSGPYVNGISESDFTLSHIMMQKWVSLYPWGSLEAWVDMRKYQYDIQYSGEYPTFGNGWDQNKVDQKWDSNSSKVYKGLYLAPAQVADRKSPYNIKNNGSPCYRLRPRYNSEYVWNLKALGAITPIAGTADNYHCSIPWFACPGDLPKK